MLELGFILLCTNPLIYYDACTVSLASQCPKLVNPKDVFLNSYPDMDTQAHLKFQPMSDPQHSKIYVSYLSLFPQFS